jgi:hypothetical protein
VVELHVHGSRAVIVSVFAALEAADRFLQDTMKIRSGEIEEDYDNNNLNDDMVNSIRTLQ